jgi:transcriptional regulator with XRE-family HTH domain
MNATAIGFEMARSRRRAGLTQVELAERIGTTQSAISRAEIGAAMPTLGLLERVANATDTSVGDILERRRPDRSELRDRVRRATNDFVFDPWERRPTAAEARSLERDGLTRERFQRRRAASTRRG